MGSAASTSHPSTTCLRSSRTSPIINLVNFDKVALSLVGTRILYSDFTDPTEDTTNMAEFDTLALRNRDVTETLSPVEDLGQDKKETNGTANGDDKEGTANGDDKEEEYDTLHLSNRVVTETLSPVDELGQDKKEQEVPDSNDEPATKKMKHDTLDLRNRDITETLTSIPAEVHDTLELRNRNVEETLTNIDIDVACATNPAEI